jgi:hypothetical protein
MRIVVNGRQAVRRHHCSEARQFLPDALARARARRIFAPL